MSVKMIAKDTLHISALGTQNILAGEEFEVSAEDAKSLERRGLAHRAETDKDALREDGPTIAEFVSAGYAAKSYPPAGYASRSTPEEIAAAVSKEDVKKQEEDLANKKEPEPENKKAPEPGKKAIAATEKIGKA